MARVVTVDIDATAVRLLQARGNRVERWASLPLEPGMVESGSVTNPDLLAQQVRRLASSSGIKGRPVVASISGVYSVSRVLRLPPQPSSRIEKSLPQLLQEAMPAPDLTPAGQVVAADGLNPQVLVVGTPANLVNAQVRALRLAGLSPKVLELKGMALTRAVNRSWAIIVNIEPSCLDIVVVAEGVPHIMRSVSLPRELATEGLGEQVVRAAQSTVAFYEAQNPERPLKPENPPVPPGTPGGESRAEGLCILQAGLSPWRVCPGPPLSLPPAPGGVCGKPGAGPEAARPSPERLKGRGAGPAPED